jgi:hypothetical protein
MEMYDSVFKEAMNFDFGERRAKMAICYDFDRTLSPDDMQTFTLIPSFGVDKNEFWGESDALAKENLMDSNLAWMYELIKYSQFKGKSLKRQYFQESGAEVKLYDGVKTWFQRINQYAESKGIEVEHYVISSGLREIIEGSAIADEFKKIYASSYLYNADGVAIWPAQAVNYTNKTQYLFRISKGFLEEHDERVNDSMPASERRIPFEYAAMQLVDVVYGDGEEDVIYLSEADWQRILRRDSTYQSLDIHLFGDTDLVSLIKTTARIRALMGNWQSEENRVTLIEHNRLWSAVTTGACNYPAIIRTLSILLILLLPLLWCAPQTMHFYKRREEIEVMAAVGRTRGMLRRTIAAECLLITLAAGAFVALLCPFSVFCIQAAIYFLELPFVLSNFDTRAYLFMIVFVMICSALSYLTAARYLSAGGDKKTKKGAASL